MAISTTHSLTRHLFRFQEVPVPEPRSEITARNWLGLAAPAREVTMGTLQEGPWNLTGGF